MTHILKLFCAVLIICILGSAHDQGRAQVPEWAKGAVWYQIFPERFRNGNPDNDPTIEDIKGTWPYDYTSPWQVHPWTANWYGFQPYEKQNELSLWDNIFRRRFGGDLNGVIEKLPYLKELGVDAIYLNPIFEAPSLHKYDASTYHHVDNNFGNDREGDRRIAQTESAEPSTWTFSSADQTFLELIQEAHALGIKIVIDGVFNHCGRQFWAFKDLVANQKNSRYKAWFDVVAWDDPATPDTNEFDYKSWWGFKDLPEFQEDEQGLVAPVRKYIFDITRRWMDPNGDGDPSDGIDGWRLDVANEVHPKFWEDWYRLVKSINPDAYITGEIWEEATEWIVNERFDAVMNYPFAYAVVDFFIDQKEAISTSEFDQRLREIRAAYPDASNHILMNLVDSHDTDRLASMIKNPDRNFDRQAGLRDNPKYDPRRPGSSEIQIQKLIAIFQMTYLGAPMIYYGDEAGMWGGDDPDDRKPMLWSDLVYENETYSEVRSDLTDSDVNAFNEDLFDHYRKLITIRHESPSLRKGGFETKIADDETSIFVFVRKLQSDEVIVILNNGDHDREVTLDVSWSNGTKLIDLMDQTIHSVQNKQISLAVSGKWGRILANR